MPDKEVQEKINEALDELVSTAFEVAGFRDFTPAKMTIVMNSKVKARVKIQNLGYRKLKGKPPLLSDETRFQPDRYREGSPRSDRND